MPASREPLLRLIRDFIAEYGDDPAYEEAVSSLQSAEEAIQGAGGGEEPSPGRRAAQEAAMPPSEGGGGGEEEKPQRGLPFPIKNSDTAKELAKRRFRKRSAA